MAEVNQYHKMERIPKLNNEEIRVLGALMEKSRTTPEYYPLTLNALVTACNQKTARKPVVEYDDDTVIHALDSLKKKGLISTATGGSSRAVKYKHNFAIVFPVIPAEVAVMSLFFLRGPQTPGEINTNSGRLYEFESLDEVQATLDKLCNGETAYLTRLPKRAGQKEQRYIHLFADITELPEDDEPQAVMPRSSISDLETRVAALEQELATMRVEFDKLMKELMG